MSESFTDDVSIVDYVIFALMFLTSAVISVYNGYFRSKSNSVEDYMFGGRTMPVIPVSLSIMASTLSSISYIAITRETYYYGSVLIYVPLTELVGSIFMYFFYIPIFYHHKFTSIFEYTERRYSKLVRCLGSVAYALTQVLYALITMFASCSAVSQVTPIPFNILAPSLCLLCTLYSVLGGLRGVVWSDVLQALFMYISVITLIVVGLLNRNTEGSLGSVIEKGGRWNHFEFDPSPYSRFTPFSTFFPGIGVALLNNCSNQGVFQRFTSLSSFRKVKLAVILAGLSNVLFLSLIVVLGLVIFATYSNCDPVLSKRLNDSNHLMIFFASETGKHIPGLIGLCMAGIISASLSSMSTMINSISCNIFEDVVKPALPWRLNEKQTNYCIKGIALFFGLVVTFGNFALDVSGGIYQVFRTFVSLAGGLIVFIFGFGIFFRKANTKGVIAGSVTGLIVTLWLGIGMQAAISKGQIKYPTKIVTNEGCQLNSTEPLPYNITTEGFVGIVPVIFDEDLPFPYRITYNYLIGISIVVSAVIGTVVSLCTQSGEPLDESLVIPLLRKKRPNINRDYTQHAEEVRNRNNVEMKELIGRECK